MKKIFLISFLFISYFSFSKSHPIERRMIGLSFSPEYSYRFLTGNDSYSWLIDLRNEMEIPKFGCTFGFNFSYQIKKKFFIEVAGCYSNKGEETKKSDLIYDDPDPNAPVTLYKRYSFSFLEIPIRLNYQVFDSSSFFASLGFAVDLPTLEKVKTFYQYSDGHESDDSFYTSSTSSRICVSAIAGIGYFFKLSKRCYLKTEPFFKCSITPSVGENVKEYFYSYGLDVGLYLSH